MLSKKLGLIIILLIIYSLLISKPIDINTALLIADNFSHTERFAKELKLIGTDKIMQNDISLAYVFEYSPKAYIMVSGDNDLEPIIAYSSTTNLNIKNVDLPFSKILKEDLKLRLEAVSKLSLEIILKRKAKWERLISNDQRTLFQQWPPAGSQLYEGWLNTQWSQSLPYNSFCPKDVNTNTRSLAGCPSVAMGQIVNYYQALNGMSFNSSDSYHHIYGANNYWIDQDSLARSFPGFYTLNNYLKACSHHFRYNEDLTNQDKGAIVFACGLAAHQIYSSQGSGTLGVSQAMEAYQRFNYQNMELLLPESPDLMNRMMQNMMEGRPVHFAIVTPAEDAGHNVVLDGYNTDGYYHVNFGWGGSQDSWYLIPDEMPSNLTVVEGAIVDIYPYEYVEVNPQQIDILSPEDVTGSYTIRVSNPNFNSNVLIEDYIFDSNFANAIWEIYPTQDSLPVNLAFGEYINFTLSPLMLTNQKNNRDTLETNLRIIFNDGFKRVKIRVNPDLVSTEEHLVSSVISLGQNYPNPFNPETNISYYLPGSAKMSLKIYNCKGQLVRDLCEKVETAGEHNVVWNGKNNQNQRCTNGIYFYKLETENSRLIKKMILLK